MLSSAALLRQTPSGRLRSHASMLRRRLRSQNRQKPRWLFRPTRRTKSTGYHRIMKNSGFALMLSPMTTLVVGAALALSSCQSDPKKPTIKVVYVKTQLPPAARRGAPLSVIPGDLAIDQKTYDLWAADRRARNVESIGRNACVAAVDATP